MRYALIFLFLLAKIPSLGNDLRVLKLDHAASYDKNELAMTIDFKEPRPQSSPIEIELKKGETLRMTITGTNWLLYKYNKPDAVLEDNGNYQASSQLADLLKTFIGKLDGVLKDSGDEGQLENLSPELKNSLDQAIQFLDKGKLEDFNKVVSELESYLKQADKVLISSDKSLSDAQNVVTGWKLGEKRKQITTFYADLNTSQEVLYQSLNKLKEGALLTTKEITKQEFLIQGQITEILKTVEKLSNGKEQNAEELKKELVEQNKDLEKFKKELSGLKQPQFSQLPFVLSTAQINAVSDMVESGKATVMAALARLEKLERDLNNASKDVVIEYSYNAQKDATFSFKIEKADNIPTGFEPKRFTGEFKVIVRPYSLMRFKFVPQVVYSFVKDPKFATQEVMVDGQTQYKILKTEDDYNKFAVGGVFSMTPRVFDGDVFQGSLDLGVSASDDELGLLLGTSLTLYDGMVNFGIGAIWQKVDELAEGLSLNENLLMVEDFKLEETYDLGVYLSLAVKLGGK